jgi:hypothetical protein
MLIRRFADARHATLFCETNIGKFLKINGSLNVPSRQAFDLKSAINHVSHFVVECSCTSCYDFFTRTALVPETGNFL